MEVNVMGEAYDPLSRRMDFIQAGLKTVYEEAESGDLEQFHQELQAWMDQLVDEAETAPAGQMSKMDIMHLGSLPLVIAEANDMIQPSEVKEVNGLRIVA